MPDKSKDFQQQKYAYHFIFKGVTAEKTLINFLLLGTGQYEGGFSNLFSSSTLLSLNIPFPALFLEDLMCHGPKLLIH